MGRSPAPLLYRQILRHCRAIGRDFPGLPLVPSVCASNWGRWHSVPDSTASELLDTLEVPAEKRDGIRGIIRADEAEGVAMRLRRSGVGTVEAFAALRYLSEAPAVLASTCHQVYDEHGVEVTATAVPVQYRSDQDFGYTWCYRIRVDNCGRQNVRVTGRDWTFFNNRQEVEGRVVKGTPNSMGVVGQMPVIEPGSGFVYYSGVALSTPEGQAEGSLQLTTATDSEAQWYRHEESEAEAMDALDALDHQDALAAVAEAEVDDFLIDGSAIAAANDHYSASAGDAPWLKGAPGAPAAEGAVGEAAAAEGGAGEEEDAEGVRVDSVTAEQDGDYYTVRMRLNAPVGGLRGRRRIKKKEMRRDFEKMSFDVPYKFQLLGPDGATTWQDLDGFTQEEQEDW